MYMNLIFCQKGKKKNPQFHQIVMKNIYNENCSLAFLVEKLIFQQSSEIFLILLIWYSSIIINV